MGGGAAIIIWMLIFAGVIAAVVITVTNSSRRRHAELVALVDSAIPPLPPQLARVIATFGATTGWVGMTIAFDNRRFILQDHGPITAAQVLEYDRQGHLLWSGDGLREWAIQFAASRPSA